MSAFNEDSLVQQTTADYLHDVLGWESVYAYNEETFGPSRTPGRASDRDTMPHLFHRNAVLVRANGVDVTLGSIAVYSAA